MLQGPHFEDHWSRVLSLKQICSIGQILIFDVLKYIYPHFKDERPGVQGGEVNIPR